MTEAGLKPCQILKRLRQSNPELLSTPKHVYNIKAKAATRKYYRSRPPQPTCNLAVSNLYRIKDDSREAASTLFPSMSSSLRRKKDHEYFQNWNAMKVASKGNSTYLRMDTKPRSARKGPYTYGASFLYSVTISSKGTKRHYQRIQSVFVAVDLSDNRFSGEIPESLGSLCGLQVLNISRNNLTGTIPSSFANLTDLESLDLSRNLLSGGIPQQLTKLTFLAVLNVSHNLLTGPIPRGKQFDTFDNSSYGGNVGLCGVPLTRSCENSEMSPPPPLARTSQGNGLEFSKAIYWMVIMMGYGSGLLVGLVLGRALTTKYHEQFVAFFERAKKLSGK